MIEEARSADKKKNQKHKSTIPCGNKEVILLLECLSVSTSTTNSTMGNAVSQALAARQAKSQLNSTVGGVGETLNAKEDPKRAKLKDREKDRTADFEQRKKEREERKKKLSEQRNQFAKR